MPVDPISPPAKIHPEEAALNLGFGQYAISYSFTNHYVHSAECIYGGGGEYCPRVQIIYSTYVINLSIIIYNPF